MIQAKNLFDCMDIHVSEVSRKVGYRSPQNFARAFKKVWGSTPYEYKLSHASMEYITSQIAHLPGDN
jgi:AraC-like DNA-binding protein